MGTTADKLNKIAQTKASIKAAIEDKGVTVGSIPFSGYPDKIAGITSKPEGILDYLQSKLEAAIAQFAGDGYDSGSIFAWFTNQYNNRVYRGANGLNASDNASRIIFNDGYTQLGQSLADLYDSSNIANSGYIITKSEDVGLISPIYWKINLYKSNVTPLVDHFQNMPGVIGTSNTTIEDIGSVFMVSVNLAGHGERVDVPALQMMRCVRPSGQIKYTTGSIRASRLWYIEGFDCWGYTNFPLSTEATIYRDIYNVYADSISWNIYNYAVTLESLKGLIQSLGRDGRQHTFQLQGYGFNLRRLQRFAPEYIDLANDKRWTLA